MLPDPEKWEYIVDVPIGTGILDCEFYLVVAFCSGFALLPRDVSSIKDEDNTYEYKDKVYGFFLGIFKDFNSFRKSVVIGGTL